MDLHIGEWISYLTRWTHLIAGISWIGSSFYFMWLDSSLEEPDDAARARNPDLEGSLWMTHSGGFYEVQRKRIGPGRMPKVLHWFKYEALFTWISGVFLLSIAYHVNAAGFMVDPSVSSVTPGQAVPLSVALIIASWFLYDSIWQFLGGRRPGIATAFSVFLAGGIAVAFCHLLAGRAAFIHFGALLGTWMVANVWVRILPAQQKMIDATAEGRAPDLALSAQAKRRSVHNTYMTFPVLFMMISNHYPHVTSGSLNWINLLLLTVLGASIRHVMVAKEGEGAWAAAPALGSLLALGLVSSGLGRVPLDGVTSAADAAPVHFKTAHSIITSRCVACHAEKPAIATYGPSPGGVRFDSPERIKSYAERIKFRAVLTRTMPLANQTGITDEERRTLGAWVDQGAKLE
ncbi:MAG TPA: urate hydroxylase PuuD [Bdellovibrionota bacterium]|nr:urate hydroxylase PuuD [Bdellovibrionota bacterium]